MDNEITRAQSPLFLQKALVKEIGELTSDMLFKSPGNEELTRLSVFEQSLPIPQKKESTDSDKDYQTIDYIDGEEEAAVFRCPWGIVKIESGEVPGINEAQYVEVVVCFGIYSPDHDNAGHKELLNLIQRVYRRFACDPLLDGQYTCSGKFEWALQEEDTYPYFFGAIGTSFKFMGYRRELKS